MKRFNILIILSCFLLTDSCNKEEQFESIIEPDFQELVDRFVTEAASRNIKIDVSRLKVTYGDTLKYYCGYGMPNDVVISSSCWQYFSESFKEFLLFHELGHAILGRMHDNSRLPNGDFTTIMNSGQLQTCYSEFTPEKREYYLDELFNANTPAPDWAEAKTKSTIIFNDTIQSGSTMWQFINGPGNNFVGKFCSTQYFSPGTCLSIEPLDSLQGWAKWSLDYTPQGINQSDKLVLSARIKTAGVPAEGGVTLLMDGRNSDGTEVFHTFVWVPATEDFTECKAEVSYYISSAIINIRFVFGNNPGIAYLDDVVLTKLE